MIVKKTVPVDNMNFNRILLFILSFVLLAVCPNTGKTQATNSTESAGPTVQKITIAVSTDTVPFHFSDDQGRPSGILQLTDQLENSTDLADS